MFTRSHHHHAGHSHGATAETERRRAPLRTRLADGLSPLTACWQRHSRGLVASGLCAPLAGLAAVLLLLFISTLPVLELSRWPALLLVSRAALLLAGMALVALVAVRIQRRLLNPLADLRDWALRMRGGSLSARLSVPASGQFAGLARDLNSLSDELEKLSLEMDQEVRKQTERIELKSRSLEILYDVAASINTSRDLDDLLNRFLTTLSGVTNAKAATVRLVTSDGQMRLVASRGMEDKVVDEEQLVSIQRCLCGQAVQQGDILSQENVRQCGQFNGRPLFNDEEVEMIAVPLQYRGKTLGVYNLFVDQPGLAGREDIQDLLTSIGRHLGVAIEKARLDEESKRLSIHRERNMLSHELHDSLAQTLASLRLQVRMLEETLQQNPDSETAHWEITKIRNGLDDAYTELRELLAHFRAPFDERGLLSAVQNVIDRFRKETDISIFFQNQWDDPDLPSVLEMQVLRIIQEALTNVRKHSRANTVRVLMRSAQDGSHTVLVEDDGIGIQEPELEGIPGEQVGMSIMKERARRLGGELTVDSEINEGTRIMLTFDSGKRGQTHLLDRL